MTTKNYTITIIFLLLFHFFTNAQTLKKVPTQYSIEAGYRNLFLHNDIVSLNNTNGYGVLLDYAWQLSGFDGRKNASFISVPLGYTILSGNDESTPQLSMLNYGWTVRHELSRNKPVIPFVGYGLLLNNLRIKEQEGSVFGHQTEFDFGLNFNTKTRFKYFIKIQYSYTSYPQFNLSERIKIHFADLRIGMRF